MEHRKSGVGTYLDAHEAAALLGVTPEVVKIWAHNNVLPGAQIGGAQHNKWLFSRSLVEEKLATLGSSRSRTTGSSAIDTSPSHPSYSIALAGYVVDRKAPLQDMVSAHAGHQVLFYEHEAVLIDELEHLVSKHIDGGGNCLLSLTHRHEDALVGQLRDHGFEVTSAKRDGRLMIYDTNRTLRQLMRNGVIDWANFYRVVGGYVGAAVSRGKPVMIFGEGVGVLLQRGDVANLVKLEQCWNSLSALMPFSIHCAYPMHIFNKPVLGRPLDRVLASHGRAVPPESYSRLESDDERARMIVKSLHTVNVLQQHMHELAHKQFANESANLAAARDDFIRLTTHHLRTPATAIKLYASMLLDGYSGNMLNQQQRRYVETIAACNDQEIALINDLLLVAQLDAGVVVLQTEPIELDAFTRDLVTAINQDKPVEHDVKPPAPVVYIGHDPLTVPADKHYLRLVICQLLGNARKYARQGVPLNITVSLRRSDSKVLIVIHDNGSGIASKYQPMLYQKFVNPADERYTPGGIGLGLHWSKRIIELHGGSLRVATRTGRGTTATISLPLA